MGIQPLIPINLRNAAAQCPSFLRGNQISLSPSFKFFSFFFLSHYNFLSFSAHLHFTFICFPLFTQTPKYLKAFLPLPFARWALQKEMCQFLLNTEVSSGITVRFIGPELVSVHHAHFLLLLFCKGICFVISPTQAFLSWLEKLILWSPLNHHRDLITLVNIPLY